MWRRRSGARSKHGLALDCVALATQTLAITMQDDDIPERAATQRSKTTSQKRASVKRAHRQEGRRPPRRLPRSVPLRKRVLAAPRAKAATAPASPRSGGPAGRRYDFVLLGATGYTGGLTAEYLAERAPQGARWAIAGRDARKLADVRTHLERVNPTAEAVDCVRSRHQGTAPPCAGWRVTRACWPPLSGPMCCTVNRSWRPALRKGRTTWISRASPSSSIRCGSAPQDRPADGCQDRALLRLSTAFRTTSARCSPPQQLPAEAPKRIEGYVRAGGHFLRRYLPLGLAGLLPTARPPPRRTASGRAARTVTTARSVRGEMMRPRFDKRAGYLGTALPPAWIRRSSCVRHARCRVYGADLPLRPLRADPRVVQRRQAARGGQHADGRGAASAGTALADGAQACRPGTQRRAAPTRLVPRALLWRRRRPFGHRRCPPAVIRATAKPRACWASRCSAWPSMRCPRSPARPRPAVAMGDALRQRLDAIGIRFSLVESK